MERDKVIFHLQPSLVSGGPRENNGAESINNTIAGNTLQLPENFSLSQYDDDDDDSGFCCPCCLPR